MSTPEYSADWIPPPGATVEDLLSRKGIKSPRRELAERLGDSQANSLNEGRLVIDVQLANKLVELVGLNTRFWLERDRLYRSSLERRRLEQSMLADLPLTDMRSSGHIPRVTSHAEVVEEVVRFFGKETAEQCRELIQQVTSSIKQKTSPTRASQPGALAVWIRAGEIEASRANGPPWNPQLFQSTIPAFRKLTRTDDPSVFLPHLRALCLNCGVRLVVMRPPAGCVARGAVKFLAPDRPALLLSFRHLSDDQFWFSFFHETAHLVLHPQSETLSDGEDNGTDEEFEADAYAADILVPPEFRAELHSLNDARAIIKFARKIGISRGILVGQLQRLRLVDYSRFNQLKVYYRWTSNNEVQRK